MSKPNTETEKLLNGARNKMVTIALNIDTQALTSKGFSQCFSLDIGHDDGSNKIEALEDVARLEKLIAREFKVAGFGASIRNMITNAFNALTSASELQNVGGDSISVGQSNSIGEQRGMKNVTKYRHGSNSNSATMKR